MAISPSPSRHLGEGKAGQLLAQAVWQWLCLCHHCRPALLSSAGRNGHRPGVTPFVNSDCTSTSVFVSTVCAEPQGDELDLPLVTDRSHLPLVPSAEGVYVIAWPLSHPWAANCSHSFGGSQAELTFQPQAPPEVSPLGLLCRSRDKGAEAHPPSVRSMASRTATYLPCSLFPRATPPVASLSSLLWSGGGSGRRQKGG